MNQQPKIVKSRGPRALLPNFASTMESRKKSFADAGVLTPSRGIHNAADGNRQSYARIRHLLVEQKSVIQGGVESSLVVNQKLGDDFIQSRSIFYRVLKVSKMSNERAFRLIWTWSERGDR